MARWVVISAFGAVILAALVLPAVVRRCPAARKRREAIARVRASHLAVQGGEQS
jgi:hypothetical protein